MNMETDNCKIEQFKFFEDIEYDNIFEVDQLDKVIEQTEYYRIIEDPEYGGLQIQLFETINDQILETINQYGITSIILSQWEGWRSQSLDFLAKIDNLKVLVIHDDLIQDLSVITQLSQLEVLVLECSNAQTQVDFSLLNNLIRVQLDWKPCFSSIGQSNSVKTLVINGYTNHELSLFKSDSLQRLEIQQSLQLTSLEGVAQLVNLKELKLVQCSNLTVIRELKFIHLETIELESCQKIDQLETLLCLPDLKCISLNKCGSITDLNGISKLNLDSLTLIYTEIEQIDVEELLKLNYSKVFFNIFGLDRLVLATRWDDYLH